MEKYFCGLAVCDVFVRSRSFSKAFCQTGEGDIQDYAPAQHIFTGIFLHTTYYYAENTCFVLLHYSSYKLLYIFVGLLTCSNYYFIKIFCGF